jgi:hypothetical protein
MYNSDKNTYIVIGSLITVLLGLLGVAMYMSHQKDVQEEKAYSEDVRVVEAFCRTASTPSEQFQCSEAHKRLEARKEAQRHKNDTTVIIVPTYMPQ